jgi:hypothetical protein
MAWARRARALLAVSLRPGGAARVITALAGGAPLLVHFVACGSPTRPTASVAAARPVSPDGAQVEYYAQPVKLLVANGVATDGEPLSITFEVATDTAFATIVASKSVPQTASGQTSIMLDPLPPATYYWRVREAAGGVTVTSPTFAFNIGPQLVIQPPAPVQPLSGSFSHKRPTFTITNASRRGPAATLTYRFEVAADPAFSALVAGATVPEGSGQTSFTPSVDLVSGGSYIWRVKAIDTAKGVTSGFSAAQFFTTVNPDDGNFPYILIVHLPAACFVTANLRGPGPPVADYLFADTLVVAGDRLRFLLPPFDTVAPLLIDAQRAGSAITGTIGGRTSAAGTPLGPFSTFDVQRRFPLSPGRDPVTFSGSTDRTGQLTATFDGFVGSSTCCEDNFACSTSGFSWTLTPR